MEEQLAAVPNRIGVELGVPLQGRVYHSDTGVGIEGVRIDAYRDTPREDSIIDPCAVDANATTTTDADGQFVFTALEPGHYVIGRGNHPSIAQEPLYERVKVPLFVGEVQAPLEYAIEPGISIIGYVRDSSGAPIEGAMVKLDTIPLRYNWTITTDANGIFSFNGIEEGPPITVAASARGFGVSQRQAFSKEGLPPFELTLPTGKWVAGTVRTISGEPVRGLHLRSGDKPFGRECTDANGHFEIIGLPDTNELRLSEDWVTDVPYRYRILDGAFIDLAESTYLDNANLVVEKYNRYEDIIEPQAIATDPGVTCGIIIDPDGVPVDGAFVGYPQTGDLAAPFGCISDAHGKFAILLHAPEYIYVQHPDFAVTRFDGIIGGSKDNRLVLRKREPVEVRVVDARTLAPVQDGQFAVMSTQEPLPRFTSWLEGSCFDGARYYDHQGRIFFESKFLVERRVYVAAKGFAPATVDVVPGQGAVTLPLAKGSRVWGSLKDDAGVPIQSGRLYLVPGAYTEGSYLSPDNKCAIAITDDSGRFAFNDIAAGTYTLQSWSVGHIQCGQTIHVPVAASVECQPRMRREARSGEGEVVVQ